MLRPTLAKELCKVVITTTMYDNEYPHICKHLTLLQRMDSDFEAFDRPYLRYDWRRAGRVGTAEFIRSTVRCGFPFTRAQVNSRVVTMMLS